MGRAGGGRAMGRVSASIMYLCDMSGTGTALCLCDFAGTLVPVPKTKARSAIGTLISSFSDWDRDREKLCCNPGSFPQPSEVESAGATFVLAAPL